VNIVDALQDRSLFGASPIFADLTTWNPWLVFLSAVYGLPLDPEGVDLFKRCTGRSTYDPPEGGWPEVACIVGRQAGKTRVASLLVSYESALAPPSRDGELYALLLAQDWRASIRASFSYVKSLFDSSEILCRSVARTTTDTLDLSNGMRVATYACRPAAIRGLRARVILLDELAYYRSSEGFAVDTEMLRAARPALATTGGKLIAVSSPYGQSGTLWDLHRRHFGRDDSPVLVWRASAPEMNPTLPPDYLERMEQDDPEAYKSEVLGEFRAGLSTLLDPEAIQVCVATDRLELPPVQGTSYQAFVDPSGGRRDAFTCAIGHRDGERGVVDVVRAWPAPFNPAGVTQECAELLRSYGISRVRGDRFGGEWPREAFRAHGIAYNLAELNRSELYLALVAYVNGARLEIPDDPELLREMRGLERRRGPSGKDRVDHVRGAHDDRANSLAGVAHLLLGWRRLGLTAHDLFGDGGSQSAYDPDGNYDPEWRKRDKWREHDQALDPPDPAAEEALAAWEGGLDEERGWRPLR
jgi:hypothetical protein